MRKLLSRPYFTFIVLIVVAVLLRLLSTEFSVPDFQIFISLYYIFIFFEWIYSIRRRFLQRRVRSLMTAFGYMMILWMLLRAAKYELTADENFIVRQMWYWYYVPMLTLPVLMFLSTLYIGRPDDYAISKKWYLLFVPSFVLIVLVLTNDFHQYAFRLHPSPEKWDGSYSYAPVYYAVAVFFIMGVAAMLLVVFRNCARRRFVRYIWLPLSVTALGVIYWLMYSQDDAGKVFFQKMFELPEMIGVFSILFWEGMAAVHLIPTNTRHAEFFAASSIRAGLTDTGYRVTLNATNAAIPTGRQVQLAQQTPVLMADGMTLLKSYAVRGGYFYWMEDIGEILHLNEQLADTEDYLLEENAMLNASNELRESVRTTAEQNALYDTIAARISPQLKKVESILDRLPEDEAGFRHQMKEAAIRGAYIKRYSNLLLIAGSGVAIDIEELALAIAESLEYVKLLDIVCDVHVSSGYMLLPELALLIYEILEAAIESALPTLGAVLVTVTADDTMLRFYAELSADRITLDKKYYQRADTLGADLQTAYNDNTLYLTLLAESGGDSA